MPNLSIKNVPDAVVARLRAQATANHRSLQGELMAIVCDVAKTSAAEQEPPNAGALQTGWMSVEELLAKHKAIRPDPITKGPLAVDVIRRDRDSR